MKLMLMVGILINSLSFAITLDEALEIVSRESRELLLADLSVQESVEKLHQSKSSYFPTIELTGGYMRMSSVPIIELGPGTGIPLGYYDNYSASINLSYPLFTSGKRGLGYRMSYLGTEIARQERVLKDYELRERVYAGFYGLLVAQEAVEIANEALERARDHLEVVKVQQRKGIVSQLDLLRAEYSYSESEAEHLRAKSGEEIARKALNLFLGIDLGELTVAEGQFEYLPWEEEISLLVERAFDLRPEMRTVALGRQMATASLSFARFKNAPNLVLSVGYSYEKPYQFEEKWGRSLTASLGVQFSLFDGFRNASEVREARIGVKKAETQEELLRRVIQFEVEKAHLDLSEFRAELSVQQKALKQAEEALRTADEQYKKGLISSLDYEDVAFAYTRAQFANLYTLYQYVLSRVRLERAVGLWE